MAMGFNLFKLEFITDHVRFLENKGEEEFLEEMTFLEVLEIVGEKLVEI